MIISTKANNMKKEQMFKLTHQVCSSNGTYHTNIVGVNTYQYCKDHIVEEIFRSGYAWEVAFKHVEMLEASKWQFSKYKIVKTSKPKLDFLY